PDGGGAEGVEVLPYGRERRAVVRGIHDVVEAHDGNVAGHVTALLSERAQRPERHLVVGDEERGRVAGQPSGGGEAGGGAPRSAQHGRCVDAGGCQSLAPSAFAFGGGVRVGGAGDVPDGAVSALEQVRD